LRRYSKSNKSGEITWKEWKETFYKWHSAIDQTDETLDNQNNDGETKTILEFTGTDLTDLILQQQ